MKKQETKIKVCGIRRQADARVCSELGADFCGFIFHAKSPRKLTPEEAAELDTGEALRVGVFVEQDVDEVKEIMDKARLDLAQLHGGQDRAFCEAVGGKRVIRVFWPERYSHPEDMTHEMVRLAGRAAYFLLDAGQSGGGHGTPIDPAFLRDVHIHAPWFLAGGLGLDNLHGALKLRPFAVDLNSGVESEPGVKDRALLERCFELIRNS